MLRLTLAAFALALCPRGAPAQVEVVGPSFVALSVADLPASVRWYRELFGLQLLFEAASPDSGTRVVLLGGPGVRIEFVWHRDARSLSSYAGAPTPPDMVHGPAKIGFFVTDLDQALRALQRQGATIEGTWLTRPAHVAASDTLWTRNLLARDPGGTYVQFFERRR